MVTKTILKVCEFVFLPFPGTSHFTQMIWKSTTDVGIAKVRLESSNKYVIVVHYKPAGNTNRPGDYGKNVFSTEEINGNEVVV